MTNSITLYSLPLIGAIIGWVTNYLAVKMLFHPRKPIPLGFFTLQGVFPKRQEAFAHKLGQIVSTELFSADDVKRLLHESAGSEELHRVIDEHIEQVITERLPKAIPMLQMILNPELVATVKNAFSGELTELLDEVVNALGGRLDDALDVHAIVEEKVANFSSDKLEEILFAIMKREFKFIEAVGAFLGFLIGCTQLCMVGLS